MAPRLAWVLNLDADLELGAAPGYTPSRRVRGAMAPFVARLASSLLAPEDVLIDDFSGPSLARGLPGRAYCPTPRAIAMLRRAGAEPEPHPEASVLRRVNSRAFAAALGATLPGAIFSTNLEEARAKLASDPGIGPAWRIKHAFGMTGRNQRVVAPAAVGERDMAFVETGLARGGVQIEPNVVIEEEYAMHGMLSVEGALEVGWLVRQRCDARGAWVATERLDDTHHAYESIGSSMDQEVRSVAAALVEAGYFGPFGVDAFAYRDREGCLRLQPRSEINARYSMGFAVGLSAAL